MARERGPKAVKFLKFPPWAFFCLIFLQITNPTNVRKLSSTHNFNSLKKTHYVKNLDLFDCRAKISKKTRFPLP